MHLEWVIGSKSIIARCEQDSLYHKTDTTIGTMIPLLGWVEGTSQALFAGNQGVICLIPWKEDYLDSMLFVTPSSRGTGLSTELVKSALSLASHRLVKFHPWDFGSSIFFHRLLQAGILTEENFSPYHYEQLHLFVNELNKADGF